MSQLYHGNSENVDYYGIADETLCPLCKLDHDGDEDIEGRYEIGSYYVKCEQRGIEIEAKTNKSLTLKYLEWHNKFTGLPSIRSKLYKRYKKETGLDPWINSETSDLSQIKDTNNYPSQNCVIKISKFPEEKDVIIEAVHKHFPFLSYTNSNAWHRDVFKYTDSEAKCPICKEVHTRYCKDDHYYLNCSFCIDQKKVIIAIQSLPEIQLEASLHQYAIEHGMDPKKFSIITKAEKNRWATGCFPVDLERDIRCYQSGIKRNEDIRKYHKFLTDWERLVGKELLRRGILKSGLSTTWLDELMKEWEGIHTQFIQIFN
ncbi:hypothetical protein Glove_481g109 [Diversispora epigaea]|uniref:Uncharacterized protein n=1 Tax=Diversispora epigaea TaxID=1348612 RepID=A0A397GTA4_9GLOM|nr:hypothetical protein Glove_481g109 [Diversispora epigaea]